MIVACILRGWVTLCDYSGNLHGNPDLDQFIRIGHPLRPVVTVRFAPEGRFSILPADALIHVSAVSGRCAAVFFPCDGALGHRGRQKGDER